MILVSQGLACFVKVVVIEIDVRLLSLNSGECAEASLSIKLDLQVGQKSGGANMGPASSCGVRHWTQAAARHLARVTHTWTLPVYDST